MTKLTENWLTDGMIDLEYKKYVLQAYWKSVSNEFKSQKLFPHLPEVQGHHSNVVRFLESKGDYTSKFPRKIVGLDLEKLQLRYEADSGDTDFLKEINSIVAFAIPRFSGLVEEGRERMHDIESRLSFSSVGIVPLKSEEGYLFIHRISRSETCIFRYQLAFFNSSQERQVQTEWVDSVRKGVGDTFENMKLNLVRKYQLPNPATYMVESPLDYPLEETLLPIAKKLMVKYINVA